jgi:GNAT superfamily N-acetyltransferase
MMMSANTSLEIKDPLLAQGAVCAPILAALPEWFGIPEAVEQYIGDIEGMPTLVARLDGKVVGFLSLKHHSPYAAEVHVMAVLAEYHRHGVGRALIQAAIQTLGSQSVEYLQVKTLSASHTDEGYARTRAFYLACGFRPLEEFPLLWDEANPCLQMVMCLRGHGEND